jgi:hypothetical protein
VRAASNLLLLFDRCVTVWGLAMKCIDRGSSRSLRGVSYCTYMQYRLAVLLHGTANPLCR